MEGVLPYRYDLLVVLPHHYQLLTVAGAKVRQDGKVIKAGGSLLVVYEGLGKVGLLLDETLGVDEQLLQGRESITCSKTIHLGVDILGNPSAW